MRFVIAIAAFIVAAVMIGVGVAQRTVWAPPANLTASASIRSDAPYVVISSSTLNANAGQQTLRVTGSSHPFVAYGRTADVMAWIGSEPYERLSYDAGSKSLVGKLHTAGNGSSSSPSATPAPSSSASPSAASNASSATAETAASIDPSAPNPNGSDLWLEQFTGAKAARTTMNIPTGVSVIVATDGAHAAPSQISVTWPMDTRTPWAGPLILVGGLLAIAGIVFYILAIRYLRRGRGPRRGGSNGRAPRLPREPRRRRSRDTDVTQVTNRSRRALGRGMIAVPVVLAGALTLAGCSSQYWPQVGRQPSATPSSTPVATQLPTAAGDQPAPAVTQPQLRNIVNRIAATAKTADATRNATLVATRFTGAALTEREVYYKIRSAKPAYPGVLAPIPTDPKLSVSLPQATATWPRAVNVIVTDAANSSTPPLDLVLTQATPRDNYKVAYSVIMLAGAKIPDVAPASIGASIVPPDSKLLAVPPSQVAHDYASVLQAGAKSPSYKLFDESQDALAVKVGAAYKANTEAQLKSKKSAANLTFADRAGTAEPVAFATNDAGALVSTTVEEAQTIKATDPAAEITLNDPNGATAALTGLTKTNKGLETDYGFQLLFYVPPVETGQQIQLLGFAQGVIGARELP